MHSNLKQIKIEYLLEIIILKIYNHIEVVLFFLIDYKS